MVFSSLLFLFRFLPAVLLLYFIIPKKFRNLLLFIASLVFYAWGEPVYVVLMLFSTLVDYTHGMLVDKCKKMGNIKGAKIAVASSMIINLSLLGFFKYAGFFVSNINGIFNLSLTVPQVALPIGISFYTFQTMSYTIDVFRDDAKVQKNIISFGAYVALFPQLIAGPIVQYKTIAEQLDDRCETFGSFGYGVKRFVTGLGKKVLLANTAGLIWDNITANGFGGISVLGSWLGIIAFTFQIYFDFSGYSDMAIGLGSMFGFKFLENFDYPYMSKSITEFWRRWHISLGTWFREYVYIPLGGNRRGLGIQIRNLLIVWLLTGFWHGASWNFVIWGLYFGIILIIEKLFLLKYLKKAPAAIGHIYTLFLVVVSWVIFAIDDIQGVFSYLGCMFGAGGAIYDTSSLYLLVSNAILLVVMFIAATPYPKKLCEKLIAKLGDKPAAWVLQNAFLIAIMTLSTANLVSDTYNPFLYFRF